MDNKMTWSELLQQSKYETRGIIKYHRNSLSEAIQDVNNNNITVTLEDILYIVDKMQRKDDDFRGVYELINLVGKTRYIVGDTVLYRDNKQPREILDVNKSGEVLLWGMTGYVPTAHLKLVKEVDPHLIGRKTDQKNIKQQTLNKVHAEIENVFKKLDGGID